MTILDAAEESARAQAGFRVSGSAAALAQAQRLPGGSARSVWQPPAAGDQGPSQSLGPAASGESTVTQARLGRACYPIQPTRPNPAAGLPGGGPVRPDAEAHRVDINCTDLV